MPNLVHRPSQPLAAGESSWLTPFIQKAHERSEGYGLSACTRPDYDVLPASELSLRVEQSRILCAHAMPVMETLISAAEWIRAPSAMERATSALTAP